MKSLTDPTTCNPPRNSYTLVTLMEKTERINELMLTKESEINALFKKHRSEVSIPLYCSGDFRDAGFKVGIVDTNLFPAGFNNLCKADKMYASKKFFDYLQGAFIIHPLSVTIIPEFHTSNLNYLENVYSLREIIATGGFEVFISVPLEIPGGKRTLKTALGHDLEIYSCKKIDNKLTLSNGEIPELIVLNNDLTQGVPEELQGLEQPMIPPPDIGWHKRKKHIHFQYYNRLASELADIIDIDPWVFTIDSKEVEGINFADNSGIDRIATVADAILDSTKKKYTEYGIDIPPYAVIKHNSGTYGIGVVTVHSGNEVLNFNRRLREKMSYGKGGSVISGVLVQEGIPTTKLFQNFVGETVLSAIGEEVVGGALRVHPEKSERENLNAPGSEFKSLCLSDPLSVCSCLRDPKLFGIYKTIMRIAIYATGYEIKTPS